MAVIKETDKEHEQKDSTKTRARIVEKIDSNGETTVTKTYTKDVELNENTPANNVTTESSTFDLNNQDIDLSMQGEVDEIPKDEIDEFFEKVKFSYTSESKPFNEKDSFTIKVIREPDSLDDDFRTNCGQRMQVGLFSFNLRDALRFPEMLQKRNNNSGGRFTLIAFGRDNKPLQNLITVETIKVQGKTVNQPIFSAVVARNVIIANPFIENDGGNKSELASAFIELGKLIQSSNDKTLAAIQALNAPKEKSIVEKALEQKLYNDIVNPKEKENPTFDAGQIMNNVMQQQVVMQTMAQGFSQMFNSNQSIQEKDWYDKILDNEKIMQTGQNLVTVLSQIAASKLIPQPQNNNPQQTANNPQQPEQPEQQQLTPEQQVLEQQQRIADMRNVIDNIVEELESENPINDDNEMIQTLAADFPKYVPMIVDSCKNSAFPDLVNMLSFIAPDIFARFKDISGNLTEQGEHVINVRLKEFYEYLRTK